MNIEDIIGNIHDADPEFKGIDIHGPTQRYYYLKFKEGEKLAKAILDINPFEIDPKQMKDVWDQANFYIRPKKSDTVIIDLSKKGDE
tara:strand:+ start:260 stop:520 length:261 start_codon:yes stop_codon:yes gene_type:complete